MVPSEQSQVLGRELEAWFSSLEQVRVLIAKEFHSTFSDCGQDCLDFQPTPCKVFLWGCTNCLQLTMMDILSLVGWLKGEKRWLSAVRNSRKKL